MLNNRRGPDGLLINDLERFLQNFRIVILRMKNISESFGVASDNSERLSELMRDHAGKHADKVDFLHVM